jgi:hypothetical protein
VETLKGLQGRPQPRWTPSSPPSLIAPSKENYERYLLEETRKGRCLLIGYNPGGDPAAKFRCRITDNIGEWSNTQNHYWSQRWANGGRKYNTLQKRVHELVKGLGLRPRTLFASNLWFLRSSNASRLRCDSGAKQSCIRVWQKFLASSPARRILFVGIRTCDEFLEWIGATKGVSKQIPTSHPRASARLVIATIRKNEYRIAVLPHLSRFSVASDAGMIRQIRRHLRLK